MFISYSRLLAFGAALIGMVLVYLFLTGPYTGGDPRHRPDRQIMTADGCGQLPDLRDHRPSAAGLAGLAPAAGAAVRRHPSSA